GTSLWLLAHGELDLRVRRAAGVCAAAMALIGAVSLAQYLLGRNFGIDQLLFSDPREGPSDPTVNPGRLAPQTAVNFILLGLSLLWLDRSRISRRATQALVLAAVAISLMALLGYVYSSGEFKAIGALHPMALHTAIASLLLGL